MTGDLGFTVVEQFAERFPDRFINVGVAEQNMLGMATGLAEAGFIPFVYSIATFATLRPLEFARNGAALHRLPVRIVGIGAGFEYGTGGFSHHAIEDVAVMRALESVRIIAPADDAQAVTALKATWDLEGPVYYRVSKNEGLKIPPLNGQFRLGEVEIIVHGGDALLLTLGAASAEAADAVAALNGRGVQASWGVVADLGEPTRVALRGLVARFSHVATLEVHVESGGLAAMVAETIATHGLGTRLVRYGVQREHQFRSGSEDYLMRLHGLKGQQVAERLCAALSAAV